MVNGVFIQGVTKIVSADTLRKDLGDLINSYNGNREIWSRMGTGMQEIYEIPQQGALIVQTDDTMRINVAVNQVITDGQVTARNQTHDINALVLLMGFKPDESYSRLYQDLSNLPQKYK
jgi:hypothetical protein